MTMTRLLAGAEACLLFAAPLRAADDATAPGADLETLRKEQRELAATMHQKRAELLERDEALRELHRKIMELHRDLAIRLDNHRELRDLAQRMRDLDAQIRRLEEEMGIKKKSDKEGGSGLFGGGRGD
jgi:chromosome segregation ATPase